MAQVQHKHSTLNEISSFLRRQIRGVNKHLASDGSQNFTWLCDLRLNFKLDTSNT